MIDYLGRLSMVAWEAAAVIIIGVIVMCSLAIKLYRDFKTGSSWLVKSIINGFITTKDDELKPLSDAFKKMPDMARQMESIYSVSSAQLKVSMKRHYYDLMRQDPMSTSMYDDFMLLYREYNVALELNGEGERMKRDLEARRNKQLGL